MNSKLLQKISRAERERLAALQGALDGQIDPASRRAAAEGSSSQSPLSGSARGGRSVRNAAVSPSGNEEVQRSAEAYNQKQGLKPPTSNTYAALDLGQAKQMADAYEALEHNPSDPKVQRAYQALVKEVKAQWDHATASGYVMEPWKSEGQPYYSSKEMMDDVRQNHHLWFFTGGDMPSDHPLAAQDRDTGLTYNDKFRAVHDLYGHAKGGYEFGPRGEHNAWLGHRQMFSDEAADALTSETAGQNNFVNTGKHLRDANGNIPKKGEPGYIHPSERPYADQKAGLIDRKYWPS